MLCSGHCYIVFVVSRCIQGIILSLPLKNSGRCVSMPKAQVIDGVMFCCCSVDTCANLWSKTRWGEMYVGMLLLYSRYVIVNGEPVCCKPPQNEGLQEKKNYKNEKKNMNNPVKVFRSVWSKFLTGKNCCNLFLFSPGRWQYMKFWCQQAWINLF